MAEDPGQEQQRTEVTWTGLTLRYLAGLVLPAVLVSLAVLVVGLRPLSGPDGALVSAAWRAVAFSAAAVVIAARWVQPYLQRLSRRRAYWTSFAAGCATLPLLPAFLIPITNLLSAITPGTTPVQGWGRAAALALLTGVHALLVPCAVYAWFGGPDATRTSSPRIWALAAGAMILLFIAGFPEAIWTVLLAGSCAELWTGSRREAALAEAMPQP